MFLLYAQLRTPVLNEKKKKLLLLVRPFVPDIFGKRYQLLIMFL